MSCFHLSSATLGFDFHTQLNEGYTPLAAIVTDAQYIKNG